MLFYQDIATHTAISTGVFETNECIAFTGARVTVADTPVMGVSKAPNTVIGDAVAVMPLCIARVRAVGAITAGQRVVSAANGGVQAQGAGVNPCGRALTTAAGDDFVTVFFCCN